MSLMHHEQTQDLITESHKSLLNANLKACEKYIEVITELTNAVKRFDDKYEKRLNDLEEELKTYIRVWK